MNPDKREPVLVYLPKENNNDETARLLSWRVGVGSPVTAGQALAEFETSKTTFELHAPAEGVVQYRHQEGDEVAVGGLVCIVSADGQAIFPEEGSQARVETQPDPTIIAASPRSALPGGVVVPSEPDAQGQRFSSPARELLSRHGLDPAHFPKRGLVRACDVLATLRPPDKVVPAAEVQPPPVRKDVDVTPAAGVPYQAEPVPRSKRLEITLLRSGGMHTLPSAVALACPTQGLRAAAERAGVNVSGVLVCEVGRLLKKYPCFNGFYAGDRLHSYQEVNVGFAFDVGLGLKVPVVRCADARSLQELDGELRELMVQYLNEELPVESLAGGTFTITDLAQEGATFFSPLINQGQSAILGVGAEFFPPGQNTGWFHLTLAFDHQVSAGREATQFLLDLSRRLGAYEKAWGGAFFEEPYCHHCERTLSGLHEIKAYLVDETRADGAKGRVCSLCLRGL